MTPAIPDGKLQLIITAHNAATLAAMVREYGGASALDHVTDNELLAALRERMVKQTPPMVVRVEPFASADAAPIVEEKAPRAPRKPREPKAEPAAAAETPREEPKATVEGTQAGAEQAAANDDWGTATTAEEAKVFTIDDVKTALNACAAVHGQAATREVMQKHGGARLMDVKAENYGALVGALEAKAAAKAQAAAA